VVSAPEALEIFHPAIRSWFAETYGEPTEIQALAWPAIASGRHVLATAPTGSGKTLCAFLWALDRLLTGAWPAALPAVLYVSPLKALNTDIRRNLLGPLRQLAERLSAAGLSVPEVRVEVRSGDTPQNERQRMLRRPPAILVTTPESLNLLLSSPRARGILAGLRTVILDEIHAVASTKRGTHLVTAVERLVPLAGEFQRLALSATVRPVARVAAFVAGYVLEEPGSPGGEARYRAREVTVLQARQAKALELTVRYPSPAAGPLQAAGGPGGAAEGLLAGPGPSAGDASIWPALVASCRQAIHAHRSTLLFTNTRRHAEKLARLINEAEGAILAYAHHGSLSREIRAAVESRLKRGELKAIVATSSLELGIDIGELDQVLLIQTPQSVASTLQRIGRAGHSVREASRGVLHPLHGLDLLEAALMAQAVRGEDIEETRPVLRPLDLLAQVILSMTGVERWDIDRLFDALRSSYPYHELSRRQYERVLDMLAGRYADSRVRELESRLLLDRLENMVEARRGVLPLVYRAGGTIPDRGYFDLRTADSRAKIGELDEEFVWERRVGDTFMLGTQGWRIRRIDARSVEVSPWDGSVSTTVFWKAERGARDFRFCERLSLALERWNPRLSDPLLREELGREHLLEEPAVEALLEFLKAQRQTTRLDLPHRHHLLLESVRDPAAGESLRRVILHTLWGGRVNVPLAQALAALWAQEKGRPLEIVADDSSVAALVPAEEDLGQLLHRLRPEALEGLLRRGLESSGFFGARFRENAGRALLLPRSDFRRRVPLWLTRQRSKKLLEKVLGYEDFPILTETWRECLEDEFDLAALKALLGELARGEIAVSRVESSSPSPFAQGVSWVQLNQAMYEDDSPAAQARSALRSDVIREALASSRLRPALEPALVAEVNAKLQRTAPGYAPRGARETLDWLKERWVLPEGEWRELLEAIRRDQGLEPESLLAELEPRLAAGLLPGGRTPAVWARENQARLRRALEEGRAEEGGPEAQGRLGLAELLGEWLRYYGPLDPQELVRLFGVGSERLREALEELAEQGEVAADVAVRGAESLRVCDSRNLETLLRLTRKVRRPSFRARPLAELPLFLAMQTCLVPEEGSEGAGAGAAGSARAGGAARGAAGAQARPEVRQGEEALRVVLETLFGYPAPAEAWEGELLPARLPGYTGAWLDRLLAGSELRWLGCGTRRLTFGFESDLPLFAPASGQREGPGGKSPRAAGGPNGEPARERSLIPERGRFGFWELAESSGLPSAELVRRLWAEAWRGRASSDSFEPVRRGLAGRFAAEPAALAGEAPGRERRAWSRAGRHGFDRWKAGRPSGGAWFALDPTAAEQDAVDREELARDRARQLLRRYGLLFRELLERELPPLRWAAVFRALRLMELGGEILSGRFFEGIPGVQFIGTAAFARLERGLPEAGPFSPWWLAAQDPGSACGLGLPGLELPPRLAGTHLVYHGARLALVSRSRGRELEFRLDPEDPLLPACLAVFPAHFRREFAPWNAVRVTAINGLPARSSPYKPVLLAAGFLEEHSGLVLRARY
jgi:ATP-dependent Lhr-like helicase